MHFCEVNGNGTYETMPAHSITQNGGISKNSNVDVTPLEHLFVTKFSRLTIDDEYKYNLAYLVTQQNGAQPPDKIPQHDKRPTITLSAKPLNRIQLNAVQNQNGPVVSKDYRNLHRLTNGKKQKPLRSKFPARHTSPAYTSSPESCNHTASDLDDRGEYEYIPFEKSSLKRFVNNDNNHDRVSTHKTVSRSFQNAIDSHYSGLNPLVFEHHIGSNMAMPSGGLHGTYDTMKFIPTIPSECHREIPPKLTKPPEQSYRDLLESKRTKLNSSDQFIRDEFCSPDVASKVQAFKSLTKLREVRNVDHPSEIKPVSRTVEDQSPLDPSSPQQNSHSLRRSITFSAGRLSKQYQEFLMKRVFHEPQSTPWIDHRPLIDLCYDCGKRIYPVDRISTGERVYHKTCFRCATCQRTLLVGNFASLDGVIFCKPHYIEQFRMSAGRYEYRPSVISK
ncbi:unnamed protein product [Trichobilharzia szidati]|nr:unnamed protein product [Trichobilharzia szidati]CAH8851077.1 unnamed protein product [Trichobilharzia szidati]